MNIRCVALGGLALSFAFLTASARAQSEIVAQIQKAAAPPVIDGAGTDAVWAEATIHSTGEFFEVTNGPLIGDQDLQVTWKGLWDDANLYVLIEVTDDVLIYEDTRDWRDDSVEIYIDAQNLDAPDFNPGTMRGIPCYQFTAVAGQNPIEGTTSLFTWGINSYNNYFGGGGPYRYPQGEDVGGMVTNDETRSFSFEVAFPWEALEETPADILTRGAFGFGVGVNDDDDHGPRNSQIVWQTTATDLWRNASVFPSVALSTETVGEGLVGDFNSNGVLDAPDIDDLTGQSAGGTNPAAYDLNADALVNDGDINVWIKDLFNSWIGDADLNGEFNSSDLVAVLASGTYESDVVAVWSTGDFNGDARTDTSDLVAALADGGYEAGPRAAVAAVPEPSSMALGLVAAGMTWNLRRRRGCAPRAQ
jgi:hypothetical protein